LIENPFSYENGRTCQARFGNILNFRGEPHIPGNDKVFSYPVRG
jgi:hypothetical protein